MSTIGQPVPHAHGEICDWCWIRKGAVHGLQGRTKCHWQELEEAAIARFSKLPAEGAELWGLQVRPGVDFAGLLPQ